MDTTTCYRLDYPHQERAEYTITYCTLQPSESWDTKVIHTATTHQAALKYFIKCLQDQGLSDYEEGPESSLISEEFTCAEAS